MKLYNLKPWQLILIGVVLVAPAYIFNPGQNVQIVLDLLWIAGVIFILSAIVPPVVSLFKRNKRKGKHE